MKAKLFVAALALTALTPAVRGEEDPVLMIINGKEIKKSEFDYIYNKNSKQQIDEPKTVSEYVDLFVNFKLKVAEAEALGIDTTATFRNELAGYRRQLAQPYLVDRKVDEELAREAYGRMLENVEVSHILLRVDPNASDAEAEKVRERLVAVKKRLDKGEAFGKVAKEVSEDPSAQANDGYIGYISAFMTVYPFETAAYNTPVGTVSDPVRTQFGWHLIKVSNRRADQGTVLASHIMKQVPHNATPQQEQAAKDAINAIYAQLQAGADFAELAKSESDDQGSAASGGALPWFTSGRMIPDFEAQVFALNQPGDITVPFRTQFGWHIARLNDRRGIEPFEEKQQEIMTRLTRDERGRKGHDALIATLKGDYGFSADASTAARLNDLAATLSPLDSAFQAQAAAMNLPQFVLAGKTYTTADFARYLAGQRGSNKQDGQAILAEKLKGFEDSSILAYEETQLEGKYADFRNLYNEYRDGMLLFEVSNREVWEKASTDTKGLEKYFKKHKKEYRWSEPRFKGFVVECADEATADAAHKLIKKAPADSVMTRLRREFNNDSVQVVRVARGIYSQGDNKTVDAAQFGGEAAPTDDRYPVAFVYGKKLKKGPESYEDVRGLVTADYQTYLEKQWVGELRKKADIRIDEAVLSTVTPL